MAQKSPHRSTCPSVASLKPCDAPARTEANGIESQHLSRQREEFLKIWKASTADSNLTLYGFRRFKTSHLLNLRFLEAEIAELDHDFYQAGLSLNIEPSTVDRLGLAYCKKDAQIPALEETISCEKILKLRGLIKEYDDALSAFNALTSFDAFSLVDNEEQCSTRKDLTLHEMYKSRQLRVDKRTRDRKDPLQCLIHKYLRDFRFRRLQKRTQPGDESASAFGSGQGRTLRNHDMLAAWLGRLVIAIISAAFLTVPLGVLSYESRKGMQLAVVAICIVAFSAVVSVMLKASNLEVMVVSAGYAAVLSVFFSNAAPGT
ncbi:hypothetical protein DBV05_g12293 [Lasiodiplodia theobromae]|uniref:DUF6594 domain-containing protein n=1 Tax=Lasiodiplodia theobromae TaxID=45133 RepID=A0A5N5CUN0_9PEZI|nr:hypothetical protein DBV05_g12293 [Lasiodiplodia theobromae]